MALTFYHGGKADLEVGDMLVPSPPHVTDGCPICVARAAGRVCTVGEYRMWLRQFGARAWPILKKLQGASDDDPMDPPSAENAVDITTSEPYATWYAARSHGDLYRVKPCSEPRRTTEDFFPSFTVESARVVAVIRRRVLLTRTERRRIEHLWKKAEQRRDKAQSVGAVGLSSAHDGDLPARAESSCSSYVGGAVCVGRGE